MLQTAAGPILEKSYGFLLDRFLEGLFGVLGMMFGGLSEAFYALPQIVVRIFNFFRNFKSKKLGLPEFFGGIERFRKVRDACAKNFHLFSWDLALRVKSYDQKLFFCTSIYCTTISI